MPTLWRAAALTLALTLLPGMTAAQSASSSTRPASLEATVDPTGSLPRAVRPDGLLPLEGTNWRLADYRFDAGMHEVGPEVAAWLTLRDGRLRGSGGCTPLRGRYASMGQAVSIRPEASRRLDCAEQTVLVERAMRKALRRAATAAVIADGSGGSRLVIGDDHDDELLRLVPDDVATLEAGEWRLVSTTLDGVTVAADLSQPSVLAFHAQDRSVAERRSTGDLVGSSGCNGFVADYARSGGVLGVSALQVADAPCASALAAQESAIREILGSQALRIELPPDSLVLSDTETGDRLAYRPATPLEGTTWQWRAADAGAANVEPVTLRLSDGIVSGEGHCGAYTGSYVTDGRFLTVTDLAGPSSCRRAARQRALFADLAATELVERAGTDLHLLDVRGRVVARLSPAAAAP